MAKVHDRETGSVLDTDHHTCEALAGPSRTQYRIYPCEGCRAQKIVIDRLQESYQHLNALIADIETRLREAK